MAAASSLRMIGRSHEIDRLERWLGAVRGGDSACATVEGEAGIGKSALLDAVCTRADELSLQVFRGGADELDRSGPFGALRAGLGVDLTPADSPAPVPGGEFRAVDQLVESVEARALDRPILIVVEDLQWGDPETIVALRAIGRRLAHLPVALLASFRPWPRMAQLETLIESWSREGALMLSLGPLDQAAVIELATELAGGTPGRRLAGQLEAAAGNPLFVRELIGALLDEHVIDVADGVAELDHETPSLVQAPAASVTPSLPPSLRLTILRRVSMLGADSVRLLQQASLLGSSFSLADLATISEQGTQAVLAALQEARRAGVVEESGELLCFRHDLVREALYADLPASARRVLHRDAGRLLAAAGAPALQVAEQLSIGAGEGDQEAVRWLSQAARECALRAPQPAAELFERALALAAADDPARTELTVELAETLVWAGRPDRAQQLAELQLGGGQPVDRPTAGQSAAAAGVLRDRARATVVRALWLDSRWHELASRAEQWLADDDLSDGGRGALLADMAMACFFLGEHRRGEEAAKEALAIGETTGDERVVFAALYALSPLYNAQGDYAAELAASERALAIAERGDNPDLARFQPHFAQAMSLNSNDRYAEAEQMLNVGLQFREQLGTVWDLPVYQAGLADLHCQMGKWDDALAEAETGVATAQEVGTRVGLAVCASIAALIHAHRDDLNAAERFMATAEEEIARSGPQWGTSYWTCLAMVQITEARGDPAAALAEITATWERQAEGRGLRVYLGPELVRLTLSQEPDAARALADAVAEAAQGMSVAGARGSALLCAGRVAADRGLLEQAVSAFAESGWMLEHAAACEALAAVVANGIGGAGGTGGAPAEARALFEAALDLYERLGARRDTARVLGAMRAAGLRRGSRAAHRQALKGWESLTATESEVVRLCVDGLTNREIGERLFISRRTVQTHLSHAFTKLEVSSRVALAALASRRD